jgi:TrkA-N domain/RyR domain
VLGVVGFGEADPARSFFSNLYLAVQLLSLQSGNVINPSFAMEFARWMAPAGVVAGVVISLLDWMLSVVDRARIAQMRGHVLVIGLGEKGRAFAASLLSSPSQVRVLAVDLASPSPESWELTASVPAARGSSITLLRGDARDPRALRAMGANSASRIFVLAGDDETNLAVAELCAQEARGGAAGEMWVHVSDSALRRALQRQAAGERRPSGVRYESYFVQLARRILLKWPLERLCGIDGATDRSVEVHLLFDGMDELQGALLLEAARCGHYLGGRKVHVHVLAPDCESAAATVEKASPAVADCLASLRFVRVADQARTTRLAAELKALPPHSVATVALARRPFAEMHAEALRLRDLVRDRRYRVLLPKSGNADGDRRFGPLHADHSLGGACGFYEERAILDECVLDSLDGRSDRVAEEIHSRWFREQQRDADRLDQEGDAEGAARIRAKASFRPWGELTEAQRVQNFAQACHVYTKLAAAGVQVRELPGALDRVDLEPLARMEHERWMACQRLEGWIPGAARNDALRVHDNFVPYDSLPELVKKSDRNAVRNICDLLPQIRQELEWIERMQWGGTEAAGNEGRQGS